MPIIFEDFDDNLDYNGDKMESMMLIFNLFISYGLCNISNIILELLINYRDIYNYLRTIGLGNYIIGDSCNRYLTDKTAVACKTYFTKIRQIVCIRV